MNEELILNLDNTVSVNNGTEIITYQFANFGERLVARLIDVLIILLPSLIIPIIPSFLYWTLQQSGQHQATVGQRAMSIKVLSLDGGFVTFGQATGRFFANLLNIFTFLVGYFMFFFSSKKQCLHDYMSGCIIVKELHRQLLTEHETEEKFF